MMDYRSQRYYAGVLAKLSQIDLYREEQQLAGTVDRYSGRKVCAGLVAAAQEKLRMVDAECDRRELARNR